MNLHLVLEKTLSKTLNAEEYQGVFPEYSPKLTACSTTINDNLQVRKTAAFEVWATETSLRWPIGFWLDIERYAMLCPTDGFCDRRSSRDDKPVGGSGFYCIHRRHEHRKTPLDCILAKRRKTQLEQTELNIIAKHTATHHNRGDLQVANWQSANSSHSKSNMVVLLREVNFQIGDRG